MIEKSCHCDSLFLAAWQHIVPIVHSVETFLSLLNIVKLDPFQQFSDLFVASCDSLLGVGIDYLVPEGSGGKIGSLRNVEKFIHVRSFQYSTCQWPKSTKYPEKWTLSTTVRSTNNCIHSSMDFEWNFFDKNVSVGRYDGNLIKVDIVISLFSPAFLDLVNAALFLDCVLVNHLCPYKSASLQVSKNLFHFVYQGCVTC